MSECDRTVETLETKILELESANSVLSRQVAEALAMLEKGRAITQALISKLDRQETWDMECERARDWAGGPEAPE